MESDLMALYIAGVISLIGLCLIMLVKSKLRQLVADLKHVCQIIDWIVDSARSEIPHIKNTYILKDAPTANLVYYLSECDIYCNKLQKINFTKLYFVDHNKLQEIVLLYLSADVKIRTLGLAIIQELEVRGVKVDYERLQFNWKTHPCANAGRGSRNIQK